MVEQKLFSFRPELKSYSFKPSEDHPTEFIIQFEEDGSALGISHEEKRVIELIDGRRSVADIVKQAVRENIAPITAVRKLLWDLDRFGLLQESPWGLEIRLPAWGYWGFTTQAYGTFNCIPLLGAFERQIGKVLCTPYFCLVSVAFFLWGLWYGRHLFEEIRLFLIQDSVALALLVVILSFYGSCLISNWLMAMVLRSIHPAPVRCLTDYRFGIPVFRMDGRRIRSLPWKRTLWAAISPIAVLLLLAGIGFTGAAGSEGTRKEWLFHLSISLWFAGLLQLLPWFSTVLSREVTLRLRGDSIFWTMSRAVQKAFRSLIRHTQEGVPHEKLFLWWGVWSIFGTVILIRLVAVAFRWDLPILVNQFLTEENSVVLLLLFCVVAVWGAGMAAAIITFFGWIFREILRELSHRFWPQHDFLLVSMGMLSVIFMISQILWTLEHTISGWIPILCGLILIVSGFTAWLKSGHGFEPLINLFIILAGFLLIASGMGISGAGSTISESTATDSPILTLWQNPSINEPTNLFIYLLNVSLWAYGCLTIATIAYFSYLFIGKFTSAHHRLHRAGIDFWFSIVILAVVLLLGWKLPIHESDMGMAGKILFLVSSIGLLGLPLWRGGIRSGYFIFIAFSMLFILFGFLWNPALELPIVRDVLISYGTVIALSGLCLRASAISKTALDLLSAKKEGVPHSTPTEWNLHIICEGLLDAASELYNARPVIAERPEANDESVRQFLVKLHKFMGSNALRAAVRRVAFHTPWQGTQYLARLLPIPIRLPRLTDWTTVRICQWLKKVPTFMHVGDEVQKIASSTRLAIYDTGDSLILQGERGGDLLVLVEGQVAVEYQHTFGHTILSIFSVGDFVGEIGFLAGSERTASVRALQPTLVLAVNRDDIDESMPLTRAAIREAESGESWLQAIALADVFREFPPSLSARVGLEAQHVKLERDQTYTLETPVHAEEVTVFLSGKASLLLEGNSEILAEGTVIGLDECLDNIPLRGIIRAESECRIILIGRVLFLEALTELLTPKQVFQPD